MEKSTDNIFKKEAQCASDKHDENGVFVKLNKAKHEISQNLISDLSENFMERRMVKIVEDMISYGK